jgi:outer membrane protein TolC
MSQSEEDVRRARRELETAYEELASAVEELEAINETLGSANAALEALIDAFRERTEGNPRTSTSPGPRH